MCMLKNGKRKTRAKTLSRQETQRTEDFKVLEDLKHVGVDAERAKMKIHAKTRSR